MLGFTFLLSQIPTFRWNVLNRCPVSSGQVLQRYEMASVPVGPPEVLCTALPGNVQSTKYTTAIVCWLPACCLPGSGSDADPWQGFEVLASNFPHRKNTSCAECWEWNDLGLVSTHSSHPRHPAPANVGNIRGEATSNFDRRRNFYWGKSNPSLFYVGRAFNQKHRW